MFKTLQKLAAQLADTSAKQIARDSHSNGRLHDLLSGAGTTIVAYQIENGFVVCMSQPLRGRTPAFVYCANHKAVAEYIVATATKQKLVGEQLDLFDNIK
jgi:hypothetical protein